MSQSPQDSCIDPRMSSFSTPISPPASETSTSQHDEPSNAKANKKKRKSWGQVLPEPTTNLPPRKRAKTDAEKQQRLYERVQRNRQAAHNSRMRKQEEMDQTQTENNQLKQDKEHLLQEVARLQEELARYRGRQDTPITDVDHSPPSLDSHDLDTTSPPSLSNGSSRDPTSPESDQFQKACRRLTFSCNVCPAVAVGNAEYFDGYGLGFSDVDSKTNLNNNDINLDNMDMPDFDFNNNMETNTFNPEQAFDLNAFLNLDDLSDSKEQTLSWHSGYVPTVASQAGFDTTAFPYDMNTQTLPGQSLF